MTPDPTIEYILDNQTQVLDKVVFLAGGCGAGKTTASSSLVKINPRVHIHDHLPANQQAAMDKIDGVLSVGIAAEVWHFSRALPEAWFGVIERSGGDGAPVDLKDLVRIHRMARDSVLAIAEKYGDRVKVRAFENKTGRPLHEITLDELRQKEFDTERTEREISGASPAPPRG